MKPHKSEVPTTSGCRGKVVYRTKRLANGVLRVMRKSRTKSDTLHVYRCQFCGKWHLGNETGSVPAPLKTVRAAVGEIVEIVWRDKNQEIRTRHEAPKPRLGGSV